MRKSVITFIILVAMIACNQTSGPESGREGNPFFGRLNEPVRYAEVTHEHIEAYARIVLKETEEALERIRTEDTPGFDNIFVAYDNVVNELLKANYRCFLLYWVSTDSLSREKGLESYQELESLGNSITSDAGLYRQMINFTQTTAYTELKGHRKTFVDDVIQSFEHSGVNLAPELLDQFRALKDEISDLSSQYSLHMNDAGEVLELDESGAEGLSDIFKESYKSASGYEIPVIPATRRPVLNNASREETRKAFYIKYQNRGWKKNLPILDTLVAKRHKLAALIGFKTFASYTTSQKMSKTPDAVWSFLNDLIARTSEKAMMDYTMLKEYRNHSSGKINPDPVNPWDLGYLKNQILISEYSVDHEKIREYFPMDKCLEGMLGIYSELLGLEYKRINNPSVWQKDVLLYEVLEDGVLQGRFYLDLYPRPHKESWFYGVEMVPGKETVSGYEIPVCMLLANFPAPTDTHPSLISHGELRTLFHEFGHIMEKMSYNGEFATQSGSKEDFSEAMSQLFENWIWDYEMVRRFANHYKTGEVLPRELFDKMKNAKNITSGLDAQGSLRNCVYDMTLYDRFDPQAPLNTDTLWKDIDKEMAVPLYVEGTHPQGSWIHINTHPTYYYGYLWAEVYAEDMFTVFGKNGLTDTETGKRYRRLVLSNGTRHDIRKSVEEFLGRPSNNQAYIKSLGLN